MSILDENAAQHNGLSVTGEMKRSWMSISKWAMFFAIIGFIYIGLSLLMIGSMGTMLQMIMAMGGDNPVFSVIAPMMSYITIISVLMMAVMFFINFYHFRFASQIQRAVNFTDQTSFEKSWLNLRNHFRLYGITVCALIVFYVILIVVIGSMMASSTVPIG
ncbi:MAG: hypothetical protein IPH31_22080 [Lewinellaceae bacterium]|nr:hypothetical protein [Lewinellaceae bacterium]